MVRSHFAAAPSVELTFAKEGQRAVAVVAKTEQLLSGHYNDMIDRNASKGFSVSVSGAEQAQKVAKQQPDSKVMRSPPTKAPLRVQPSLTFCVTPRPWGPTRFLIPATTTHSMWKHSSTAPPS
jgi:hypothetical protein